MKVPAQPQLTELRAQRFSEQAIASFRELARMPWVDGTEVALAPALAAGVVRVEHLLGKVVTGWLVTECERDPAVTAAFSLTYRTGDVSDSRAIELYASTAFGVVTLWVW